MEIARHWRLRKDRYCLRGEMKKREDGTVQFKLNGSNRWTEPQPNGHYRYENPLEGEIIFQAKELASDNGREPVENHDSVEISASSS